MLISDMRFHWTCGVALAAALLAVVYFKLTALALYRRRRSGSGAVLRIGAAMAIAAAVVIVFMNLEHRGSRLWIYTESNGALIENEFLLFGKTEIAMRDSKTVAVAEEPSVTSDHVAKFVLNDASKPLKVPFDYPERSSAILGPGLLLRTTDYFYGKAEFAP